MEWFNCSLRRVFCSLGRHLYKTKECSRYFKQENTSLHFKENNFSEIMSLGESGRSERSESWLKNS